MARDVAEATRTVSDVARAVSAGVPIPKALLDATVSLSSVVLADSHAAPRRAGGKSLRERGEELLQRSRDVWSEDEDTHPAYARILDDLAPDEARILLLLLRGGPQPSVDVRTGGPIGLVSSALVAPGMSMIGARAGCRYLDEVPAYLNNLFRLGLIWFSREQLEDPMEYQVVEAQPDVLDGDALGALPQGGPPLDPPHAVRGRLLPGLPGRSGGDRRAAGPPDPRGVDRV